MKTTNAGSNWAITYDTIALFALNSINLISNNIGYAVGDFGGIIKTTNGGSNWTIQSNSGNSLYSVSFYDSLIGTVVGTSGRIRITTNGGINWLNQTSGVLKQLYSVKMYNLNSAIAVGEGGVILYTTNSGIIWNTQMSNNSNYLYSVFLTNVNIAYVSGDFGSILKTTNSGLVGINDVTVYKNKEYHLSQNYPNPFNPITIINYELPASRQGGRITNYVSLKVFDVLGNEVANLVNEKKNPGSYKVEFNGSNLSSGIYFYSLYIEGVINETKKCLLIK